MKRKIVYDIKKLIDDMGAETSDSNALLFAGKVGVSIGTVKNWREDKTRLDLNQLEKILNAFSDLLPEDLFWVEEVEPELIVEAASS